MGHWVPLGINTISINDRLPYERPPCLKGAVSEADWGILCRPWRHKRPTGEVSLRLCLAAEPPPFRQGRLWRYRADAHINDHLSHFAYIRKKRKADLPSSHISCLSQPWQPEPDGHCRYRKPCKLYGAGWAHRTWGKRTRWELPACCCCCDEYRGGPWTLYT